jgi:hypothetical protein
MMLIAGTLIILVLAILVAVVGLYRERPPVTKPFAFNLSINPNNGTAMQAQNVTISANATYIEGIPEPITLLASGGPNGTLYQFSNQTGTPTRTQPFTSNLTIILPPAAASGFYIIDIASNANVQTSHTIFNLTVTKQEIKFYKTGIEVYGNVTIETKITVSGVTLDVVPTDILFTSNITGKTYQVKIHRFTDTDLAPGKTGSYSIQLPNQQSYDVKFYCFSYPHYIPVLRTPISPNETGYFAVSCEAGEESFIANFIG